MDVHLQVRELTNLEAEIHITGSKSESNRLLILQALYPGIQLKNTSGAQDTELLKKALQSTSKKIDIHHAGTAMRFLTAYFSVQKQRETILTGSRRMQERPIGILVEALRRLGANISYLKKEGFPPIHIQGKTLLRQEVSLPADVSSQYISALMLIAPSLEKGLQLHLERTPTSRPYIEMTLALLKKLGVQVSCQGKAISITPFQLQGKKEFVIEPDWSAASYFYSAVALSEKAQLRLPAFRPQSIQGDAVLQQLYTHLGVRTSFLSNGQMLLTKAEDIRLPKIFKADLSATPDIAQTIAVTCLGLGIVCKLTGLHTLKIKETDRLYALKTEMEKLGGIVEITSDSLFLQATKALKEEVTIQTYNDHRMAMAFTPLALKTPLIIEDAEVVAKSFPDFWKVVEKLPIDILF